MNKKDLISTVARNTGLPQKSVALALDATLSAITNSLIAGEEVRLHDFGTFEVRHRKSRTGLNPKTGEKIEIAAINAPAFKAAKKLKDQLK